MSDARRRVRVAVERANVCANNHRQGHVRLGAGPRQDRASRSVGTDSFDRSVRQRRPPRLTVRPDGPSALQAACRCPGRWACVRSRQTTRTVSRHADDRGRDGQVC